jgi:hypothetical protein
MAMKSALPSPSVSTGESGNPVDFQLKIKQSDPLVTFGLKPSASCLFK